MPRVSELSRASGMNGEGRALGPRFWEQLSGRFDGGHSPGPSCDGAGYIIENEDGRGMYFRKGSDEATCLRVWLAQKRLYVVSVSYKKNKFENDPVLWKELNDFLDAFLLIKKSKEENRYTVGLPPSASQHPKNPDLN